MLKTMQLPPQLLLRKKNSHKGDYGHVLIVGGSLRFSGAVALAAEAASRSGTGLVTVAIPRSIVNIFLKKKPKEIMTLPLKDTKNGTLSLSCFNQIKSFLKNIDVLAIGCGLTQESQTQRFIRKVIKEVSCPQVIDADGINALVGHLELIKNRKQDIILTPHPGEMARLLHISVDKIQKDRKNIALEFVRRYNVILVLKGYETIVASNLNGIFVNNTGNPGMAKGGSGDVLTGIIAAFRAQGLNAFDAAKYGVYLHGLAGDIASKKFTQIAMTASDIITNIPNAIKKCSRRLPA
ncbi:MAG: NAD(P)H-hydrate dehydratase [Candidatus Omnitrophica bacterium]|nr:NAD(P)H-hydrate dehydratase [Candidatus Omnitrophota bacterium]